MQMITTLSSTLNQSTDGTQHKTKSVESLINYELGKVIEWLNINRLSLNKEKSKKNTIHTYIERLTICIITTCGSCDSDFSFLAGTIDPHFTVLL